MGEEISLEIFEKSFKINATWIRKSITKKNTIKLSDEFTKELQKKFSNAAELFRKITERFLNEIAGGNLNGIGKEIFKAVT